MSIEIRELDVRFIPIMCAAPLVYATMRGIFDKNGLSVRLRSCPGWSGVKELLVHGRIDAAHVLVPMTLSTTLGLDGKPVPLRLCAIQNVNGQALILAKAHQGLQQVKDMRGFRFGVPYLFSMHYYLLCDFLAKHGLDPRVDVKIEEIAPPRMPNYIRTGRVDAVLSPEPFAELLLSDGTGTLFAQSDQFWPGHPCCSFAVTKTFSDANPETCAALVRSLVEAEHSLRTTPRHERANVAREIAIIAGWDAATTDAAVRVLSDDDGDKGPTHVQSRIDFIPEPFREYGLWMLAQMQRWGQLEQEIDPNLVDSVFMTEDVKRIVAELKYPEARPNLGGVEMDSIISMRAAPFGAFREKTSTKVTHDLSAGTRSRMDQILAWLARVVAAEPVEPLEITSSDAIGWLERMLNEAALNAHFSREALAERVAMLERAREQEAIIVAQGELIQELSAPIMPIFDRVLALPLVGALDDRRANDIMSALLDRVMQSGAEVVLIDVTGMSLIDDTALDLWIRMTRAVALLGAECVVVGIRPNIARGILERGEHGNIPRTCADLQGGIEYALRRTGRKVTLAPTRQK